MTLWTCRTGEEVSRALDGCHQRGIEFDAVNDNLPELIEAWNDNPRKVFANRYIDDCAGFVKDIMHVANFYRSKLPE